MIVIRVDVDEVRRLREDLAQTPERVATETRKVVAKGALNIKKGWRRRWSRLAHAPHVSRAIDYDLGIGQGMIEAEIGPSKERVQGPLGNILEYGTIHNAPIPGGLPELRKEEPRFARAMLDLAEKATGI